MPTPKYIFTSANGQLIATLDNALSDFENSEILEYRAPSVHLYNPIVSGQTKKIHLFDFGEYEREFLFENIKTIGGATPSDISNAYTLLQALIPIPYSSAMTQSGTWTVQVGNTPNTTPILANHLTPVVSTTGDTGAKTATGNGATQTNVSAKGALVVVNLGTVTGTTPTAVFKLQGSADSGTTWVDLPGAATATLTATGVYAIEVFPGITTAAGVATSGNIATSSTALPRTWRVVWTLGGTTPSFTITNIQVNYIL